MESPVKKLNFNASDKENQPLANAPTDEIKKPLVLEEAKREDKVAVASGIKAEETDEPLLMENPNRFVLFPIKYHEVCDASETRKVACSTSRATLLTRRL